MKKQSRYNNVYKKDIMTNKEHELNKDWLAGKTDKEEKPKECCEKCKKILPSGDWCCRYMSSFCPCHQNPSPVLEEEKKCPCGKYDFDLEHICCSEMNGPYTDYKEQIKKYVPQEPIEWESRCRDILFDFWKGIRVNLANSDERDIEIEKAVSKLSLQIKQTEDKYKTLLNSGRKMYELGKKDERERIVKIINEVPDRFINEFGDSEAHILSEQKEIIINLITNQ